MKWELSHKFYRVKKRKYNKITGEWKETNKFEIISGNVKLHWVLIQKRKKEIENIFYLLAKQQRIPRLDKTFIIYKIIFPDRRQRDRDNFEWIKKGINDGIKQVCCPCKIVKKKYNKCEISMVEYLDDIKHLIETIPMQIKNNPKKDYIEIKATIYSHKSES